MPKPNDGADKFLRDHKFWKSVDDNDEDDDEPKRKPLRSRPMTEKVKEVYRDYSGVYKPLDERIRAITAMIEALRPDFEMAYRLRDKFWATVNLEMDLDSRYKMKINDKSMELEIYNKPMNLETKLLGTGVHDGDKS